MKPAPDAAPQALPPDIGLTDSQITRLLVLLASGATALVLCGGLAMALLGG